MSREWTRWDERWLALTPYQRAAAMALLEADGARSDDARNALGAMINRAAKTGENLGEHVSRRIYQPAIEPAQQARLGRILAMPAFNDLTAWAQRRAAGLEPDPVKGATHFLAHPEVMLRLSGGVRPDGRGGWVGNSSKYYSWPRWTGFNPETGTYRNQTFTDRSHAFLAPEGLYSVAYRGAGSTPDEGVAEAPRQRIASTASLTREVWPSSRDRSGFAWPRSSLGGPAGETAAPAQPAWPALYQPATWEWSTDGLRPVFASDRGTARQAMPAFENPFKKLFGWAS